MYMTQPNRLITKPPNQPPHYLQPELHNKLSQKPKPHFKTAFNILILIYYNTYLCAESGHFLYTFC